MISGAIQYSELLITVSSPWFLPGIGETIPSMILGILTIRFLPSTS
jgi:hypothetical protein